MIMCSVFINYCVCRRPSWKPRTQPNGSSAVVWLSFWFSTRFTRKTLDYSNGICHIIPYFFCRFGLPESLGCTTFSALFRYATHKYVHSSLGCRGSPMNPAANRLVYKNKIEWYTWFLPLDGTFIFYWIELKTKNSTNGKSCRLVEFLVFKSAFGWHSNQVIPSTL